MSELVVGAFRVDIHADGSDTEALYGSGPPTRWLVNIRFSDPEGVYRDWGNTNDGSFLIKSKLVDGIKEQAFA